MAGKTENLILIYVMDNKVLMVGGLVIAFLGINYFRNNNKDNPGGGGNIIIDTVANRVIEKLQKEYSPSPYGPGMDPDQIDVNAIRMRPTQTVGTSDWDRDWQK